MLTRCPERGKKNPQFKEGSKEARKKGEGKREEWRGEGEEKDLSNKHLVNQDPESPPIYCTSVVLLKKNLSIRLIVEIHFLKSRNEISDREKK